MSKFASVFVELDLIFSHLLRLWMPGSHFRAAKRGCFWNELKPTQSDQKSFVIWKMLRKRREKMDGTFNICKYESTCSSLKVSCLMFFLCSCCWGEKSTDQPNHPNWHLLESMRSRITRSLIREAIAEAQLRLSESLTRNLCIPKCETDFSSVRGIIWKQRSTAKCLHEKREDACCFACCNG